jgi:hypothetical protein
LRELPTEFDDEMEHSYLSRRLEQEPEGRKLSVLWTTTDTAKCGRECISKFYHFCPSDTYSNSGVCCDDKKSCRKADFCSYHAPANSRGLKFWACPFDKYQCGKKGYFKLGPKSGDFGGVLIPNGPMKAGKICRYKIEIDKEGTD